jgi:putative tryptophan/tyrosine transport system permease protein
MELYLAAIIQGLCYASLGIGVYLSLRIFKIPDITTDGSFTLGGVVAAVGLLAGWSVWVVIPVTLLAGVISGATTGFISTRLRINPLLSGILVMTALYSINLAIMGRSNIPLDLDTGLFSSNDNMNQKPLLVAAAFAFTIAMIMAWMLKTDLGIAMRATGNNEQMASANGVNINRMKILGLAIANALTSFSGFLMVQYQGFADVNMGVGIIISGLAAVMIGESISSLFKINRVWAILICMIAGSMVFRLAVAQSLAFGLNPNYLKLVTAGIVLAIVAVSNLKGKRT